MSVQVWAYANLGYDPGALMDAVAQCSEDRMRGFTPQNISNILWAFAKLGMFLVLLTAKQCSRPWISDSAGSSCLPQVYEHLKLSFALPEAGTCCAHCLCCNLGGGAALLHSQTQAMSQPHSVIQRDLHRGHPLCFACSTSHSQARSADKLHLHLDASTTECILMTSFQSMPTFVSV